MLKKLSFIATALTLTACASNVSNEPQYKISDVDAKKYLLESRKAEQCLFPQQQWQTGNLPSIDKDIAHHFIVNRPMIQTIGTQATATISQDEPSQDYLVEQLLPFWQDKNNKVDFDQNWCKNLTAEYQAMVNEIRGTTPQAQTEQQSIGSINTSNSVEQPVGAKLDEIDFMMGMTKSRAEKGDAGEQAILAMYYQYGIGVEKDYKKALYWYQKAANAGHIPAQINLGNIYRTGDTIKTDYKKARYWFNKACQAGDSFGCKSANELRSQGY